ncbi:type II secretion system minor pseudopilin GspI [Plesiomonas shigelloides]|uniref:type II secretion system minor pseudopilin GspI n=1 Tax=Plesiomonas shigelloides TaxID=703 RepID=UPI001C5A7499|nr:type II secretion system minor pseudopilin GspI [Plesiomonas shigelloides]MBW3792470.1 type II secretion system minor pseudopilin GspI [Plesiomonas shigelloides]
MMQAKTHVAITHVMRGHPAQSKPTHGFTLLEVLVALAVFAGAALAVMQAGSSSLRNLAILQDKMLAGWVAENQLALLSLLPPAERQRSQRGETQMANRTWYWRSKSVPTSGTSLTAIEIQVSRQPQGSAEAVLRRYFARSRTESAL